MPEPGRLNLTKGYGTFEPFTIENAPRWDDIEPRLEAAHNYWIAVSDELGPLSVPVWGIWSDLSFTFATDPKSRKGRAIAAGSRCQVNLESGDDVVIVVGRVEQVHEGQWEPFLDAYLKKYGVQVFPDDPTQIILRVIPDVAMTWLEMDFANSAARWEF
jgi:hypothetical protein